MDREVKHLINRSIEASIIAMQVYADSNSVGQAFDEAEKYLFIWIPDDVTRHQILLHIQAQLLVA
jgi:hypothetical protein